VKVAVGVLTFNRLHLLQRTLASLRENTALPFDLVLVDGGSRENAQRAYVVAQGGILATLPTVGESMNYIVDRCLALGPDVVVFSADDYEYRPGWLESLVEFWSDPHPRVAIATLNWEPLYRWNQVVGTWDDVLFRQSVPGSSWSFLARDWPLIGPVEARTGGEDLAICRRLRSQGYELAALDLSEHIGEAESAWGNQSYRQARPLVPNEDFF